METLPYEIYEFKEMHRFLSIIMNFEEIQFMLFTTIHGFYPIHDNGIVNSLKQ